MPSPFPGMDPYIEEPWRWGDFHNTLAAEIRTQLNAKIRPRYYALTVPYVTYDTLSIGRTKRTVPDVSVFQSLPTLKEAKVEYITSASASADSGDLPQFSETQPVENEVEIADPLTLYFVEIRTVGDGDLVTVIEILSPVNKRSGREGYDQYLNKRQQILNTDTVHLLEIDLLRGGTRPPLVQPVPNAPYYVVLSRADRRPQVTVWPIQLDERLPTIETPLAYPDPDVSLNLGEAVTKVYDGGAYDIQIDYTTPPPPPKLTEKQLDFLNKLLQASHQQ